MGRMVKKTIVLNQDYIDIVRGIFWVKTDKQEVNNALEMIIIDN